VFYSDERGEAVEERFPPGDYQIEPRAHESQM